MKQPIQLHTMLTRRHFLKKAGYGLVLVGGTRGLIADAVQPGDAKGARLLRAGATPAWLRGVPLNQWHAIPGTEMSASQDLGAQIAAGLTNDKFQNVGYGDPRRGIMDYSGGAFRNNGSEMLLFGGGGAGAWAGNDVRGLSLEDDTPRWHTLVKPANASNVWTRYPADPAATPHPYMRDGVAPNARHSVDNLACIDATDEFMSFRCFACWETDSGHFRTVDSANLVTGAWSGRGDRPNVPGTSIVWGNWVTKHPTTENIYACDGNWIHIYDYRQANPNNWVRILRPGAQMYAAAVAIDPTRNILFRVGLTPGTVDVTTGAYTAANWTGPDAGSIVPVPTNVNPGLVYDAGLDAFLYFQDDQELYKISYLSAESYSVQKMALAGTKPSRLASGVHNGGRIGIWGRMAYVPKLKGVCIVQAYNQSVLFVRTA